MSIFELESLEVRCDCGFNCGCTVVLTGSDLEDYLIGVSNADDSPYDIVYTIVEGCPHGKPKDERAQPSRRGSRFSIWITELCGRNVLSPEEAERVKLLDERSEERRWLDAERFWRP